jgi:hypothetical protein
MKKTIEIEAYLTPSGIPICAKNIKEGKFCIFLRYSHFGTKTHCCFTDNELSTGESGYTEPDKSCPLWRSKDVK